MWLEASIREWGGCECVRESGLHGGREGGKEDLGQAERSWGGLWLLI